MLRKKGYLFIPADVSRSPTASDRFKDSVYEQAKKLHGKQPYFSLLKNVDTCLLIKSTTSEKIPPENKAYSYVIVLDEETMQPQLKIGNVGHFFLAEKASSVLAAGNITFENGKIIQFDDRAGTYYLKKPREILEYQQNINTVFSAVGLPMKLYVPTKPLENQKSYCSLSFFCQVVLPPAAIVGIAAIAYLEFGS